MRQAPSIAEEQDRQMLLPSGFAPFAGLSLIASVVVATV